MKERKIDTGTLNIGIVYNEPGGRKGVVLLTDRKISQGSLGLTVPTSYKLRSLGPNMSMASAGSAGDNQWLADTAGTILMDGEDTFKQAVRQFSKPTLSEDDINEVFARKFTKDITSKKIRDTCDLHDRYDLLLKRYNVLVEAEDESGELEELEPTITEFEKKIEKLKLADDAELQEELASALKAKQEEADKFFKLREFMLETYSCKDTGQVRVRRALPVKKSGWSGTKTYPAVGVAFQRRAKKNGKEEVLPTVDGTANLLSNILHEKEGYLCCEGLIGGVDGDGPKLFQMDENGCYIPVELCRSTGSGSVHITTDMDRKSEEKKKKGHLTREDALWLALYGAIPVSTGTDNYVGPPLDMVVIEEDNKTGEIASYKVTIDLSVDKKNVIVPDVLEMEVLRKETGETAYYTARVKNDKNKTLASIGSGTGGGAAAGTRYLQSGVRNVARSYLKVLNEHASK